MKVYVYEITNTINGKIYVGVHKAKNDDFANDGYWGSGALIKNAIKKYGLGVFTKRIISVFDNYDDALIMEGFIVDETFVSRSDTYNLCRGGQGGFLERSNETCEKIRKSLTGRKLSKEHCAAISSALSGDKNSRYGTTHTQEAREKMSKVHSGKVVSDETKMKISSAIRGRTHTDETKQKMRNAKLGKQAHNKGIKFDVSECPHCGKIGGKNAMTRWHFENCKHR